MKRRFNGSMASFRPEGEAHRPARAHTAERARSLVPWLRICGSQPLNPPVAGDKVRILSGPFAFASCQDHLLKPFVALYILTRKGGFASSLKLSERRCPLNENAGALRRRHD